MRIAAILVPAAILLHESCSLMPGAPLARPDGPLPVLLPLLATVAAALLSAGLLSPLLRGSGRNVPSRMLPLVVAGSLLTIFLAQEGSEVLLRTRGLGTLGAALTGLAVLVPLALALGSLVALALMSICRVARAIILGSRLMPARRVAQGCVSDLHEDGTLSVCLRPLAFGLARRPPPASLQPIYA